MNQKQFYEKFCTDARDLMAKKNHDYAGAYGATPLANFEAVLRHGVSIEDGFITRMTDKLCRLQNFDRVGVLEVEAETVRDTCIDLANYAILYAAYRDHRVRGLCSTRQALLGVHPELCEMGRATFVKRVTADDPVNDLYYVAMGLGEIRKITDGIWMACAVLLGRTAGYLYRLQSREAPNATATPD